jgi:glyoxylase-like metal-dependent hydrolase (beta-lactamase superfamily II)
MVIEQVKVGPMAVFCYILGDENSGEALLVDPASNFDKILFLVNKNKLKVSKIINTHGHFDHTSGNRYFTKKYGSDVYIHELDSPMLKSGINRIMDFFKGWKLPSAKVKLLNDGDIVKLGSEQIKVIHTPGHTPGSICLYWKGNLFTGDTLFTEGMGRTDFKGGSSEHIMNSIRSRILTLPDDTVIWPGHHYGRFPVSTVKEQKRYYL